MLAFHNTTRILVSGGADFNVKIFRWVPKLKCVHTLTGHTGIVRVIVFINDRTICTGGDDGTIRKWDVEKGKEISSKSVEYPDTGVFSILPYK